MQVAFDAAALRLGRIDRRGARRGEGRHLGDELGSGSAQQPTGHRNVGRAERHRDPWRHERRQHEPHAGHGERLGAGMDRDAPLGDSIVGSEDDPGRGRHQRER